MLPHVDYFTYMANKLLVWDLPLRLFHWLFALSLMLLWLTAELGVDYRQYHFYLGYFVLFLLIFRVIWGFIGTRYARFSEFFPTFKKIYSYNKKEINQLVSQEKLKASANKDTKHGNELSHSEPLGHNPLGAIMVFVMLLLALMQATSGLFISDDILFDGPYFGVLSSTWQSVANNVHHYAFNGLLAAIAMHISAIIYHEKCKKHPLVIPMINGKKLVNNPSDAITHSALIKALFVAMLSAGCVYWIVVINAPVIDDYFF